MFPIKMVRICQFLFRLSLYFFLKTIILFTFIRPSLYLNQTITLPNSEHHLVQTVTLRFNIQTRQFNMYRPSLYLVQTLPCSDLQLTSDLIPRSHLTSLPPHLIQTSQRGPHGLLLSCQLCVPPGRRPRVDLHHLRAVVQPQRQHPRHRLVYELAAVTQRQAEVLHHLADELAVRQRESVVRVCQNIGIISHYKQTFEA